MTFYKSDYKLKVDIFFFLIFLLTSWNSKHNLAGGADVYSSSSSWSTIVVADFHGAETFSYNPDPLNNVFYQHYLQTLTHINYKYGGDVMLLPGDSNHGRWYERKYVDIHFPGQTIESVVYKASMNCYKLLRKLFYEAGYKIALMAVGDHELGDNGWFANTTHTRVIEHFRQGFRYGFNADDNEEFLYKDDIVADGMAVPSTPLSTNHEFLSFAFQHKNALFVTIDLYEQVSTTKNYVNKTEGTGGEGVVTGTMRNEHLDWFEKILKVAKRSSSIKHIIVQAHIPVKEPVRKVKSSAMSIDHGVKSEFWKLMVQYGVDLYLSGEVHATTCTKDDNSNLIQIASRGNGLNGFIKIIVTEDRLQVIKYREVGPKYQFNNNYTQHGMLVVDKSNNVTNINSYGALKLIDSQQALIRFSFEETHPMITRQVEGLKQMNGTKKIGLIANSTLMRNVTCTRALPNLGNFGKQYDAQVANLNLNATNPISGQGAAYFSGSLSRHSIFSFGPHSAVTPVSFSLWVRTWKSREMILVHYGAAWANKKYDSKRSIFSLTMKNGRPRLYARENAYLTSVKNTKLDDGQWHHIAVSMPRSNCKLSEVRLYVDGQEEETKLPSKDEILFFLSYGRISLGGLGYSAENYEKRFPDWNPYIGAMDEFILWSRQIEKLDLAWAMKKNFEEIQSHRCVGSSNKVVLSSSLSRNQCKQRCQVTPPCFGFEVRRNECTLFHDRPSKGQRSWDSFCAISK